ALGRAADRGGQRAGGLEGVSRSGGAGAQGLAGSQAGWAGRGHHHAGADAPAAVGGVAAKPGRAQRPRGPATGPGEEVHAVSGVREAPPQAEPEDGMRLTRPLPMLAVPAAPFDSTEYSFEVKWDGVRALAAVETTGWRLWGRQRADYTARYPELAV